MAIGRAPGGAVDQPDRDYDRKLALMERRLAELGTTVDVIQQEVEPEAPWTGPEHDQPHAAPGGGRSS